MAVLSLINLLINDSVGGFGRLFLLPVNFYFNQI